MGSYIIPLRNTFLNLSGGTVTGLTIFTAGVSATTISASTIFSGSTDLGTIISGFVNSGQFLPLSGGTGGPYIFTGLTIANSFSATTLSGGTIYSGSTELSTIFALRNELTRVQNGINTFTGGTAQFPTVNITAATLSTLVVSGNTNLNILSANTLSAGTIYSGSTDIGSFFGNLQTQIDTKANRSGDTFTGTVFAPALSATSLSGGTIYSGTTELSTLFATPGQLTRVQNGINTFTGGTPQFPTVNITAATLGTLVVTGNTNLNNLSANTVSAATIYSGSTNIGSIFLTAADISGKYDKTGGTISGSVNVTGNVSIQGNLEVLGSATTLSSTTVQTGDNNIVLNFSGTHLSAIGGGITVTSGQTNGNPSFWATDSEGQWVSNVNVIAPGFSGTTGLFTSLSGTNIFSGSANLSATFASSAHTHTISDVTGLQNALNTKANLSGATFTGTVFAPSLSATTLSGGTIYSGNTELSTIVALKSELTRVQNGTNTFTGGTAQFPTVNITAATLSTLVVSGNTNLNTLSANTVSGGTIYSGSTNISNIFAGTGLTANLQAQIDTKANRSGDTFTGTVFAPGLSASTLSGGTIYSGSTNLETIISSLGTRVQNGINTFTGGTAQFPTVNITAATLSTLIVTGNTNLNTLSANTISATTFYSGSTNLENIFLTTAFINNKYDKSGGTISGDVLVTGTTLTSGLSASTLSGGTIYSGSTELSTIFALKNELTRVQNGTNTFTGGTAQFPTVNITAATLNTLTVTGNTNLNTLSANTVSAGTIYSGSTDISSFFGNLQTQINTKANRSGDTFTGNVFTPGLSASTLSGGTIYSGSTNLETIISSMDTRVQNGTNTFTGGTAQFPTVNITAATLSTLTVSGNTNLNTLSANTVSAGTIYSGSTNIANIFAGTGLTTSLQAQINTKANRSGDTFTGTVFAPGLSASTLSGGTIYSGSTNLEIIISSMDTRVQNGTNTFTGGTAQFPTVNVTALTIATLIVSGNTNLNTLSANTVSGGTIYSGSTNLSNIFAGTGLTANLQAQIDTKANRSGDTFTGTVFAPGLSASTLSGGTIYSGTTELSTIFALRNELTRVQNGINTFTGGTAQFPTVNITAATLSTLIVSGNTNLNTLSANTVSGGTIYSGSTNISNIFAGTGLTANLQAQIDTKANRSGDTFTGTIFAPSISATSISASTFYSGSTELSTLFALSSQLTRVQNGTNTFTGGTATFPTVNITGATLDNLVVSGIARFNSISATTVSGGTIYSGSTDLGIFFGNLQTQINTKANRSGDTFTGTVFAPGLSASTLSGGTLYSGATELSIIFSGSNLWAPSTGSFSIIANNQTGNLASAAYTLVAGNANTASTAYSTVIGGQGNLASGGLAFIGAGRFNTASTSQSAVVAGRSNLSSGLYSIVGAGKTNVASGNYSGVLAGVSNKASGVRSFIGGGNLNSATTSHATVAGGQQNLAGGLYSFIGGGRDNIAKTGNSNAVVGGIFNKAYGIYAFVGGGQQNTASGFYTFIGGGRYNTASFNYAVVVGGQNNTASGYFSFIGNGNNNTASTQYSTIVGGNNNLVSGDRGFIGGGSGNTVSGSLGSILGGAYHNAIGSGSTIIGGFGNISSGFSQTVIGKYNVNQGSPSSWILTDNAFIIGTGASNLSRKNALSVTWEGKLQLTPFTGSTLPTTNVLDGALAYSANTGLYQFINNTWVKFGEGVSGTTDASNVGGTEGIFKQKVANILQFKSLSGSSNISLTATTDEIAIYLKDNIVVNSVSGNTISGGTIYSGSTNLETIIYNISSLGNNFVQNGLNTYTGGTPDRPTVNISAATLDNLTVSGNTALNNLTATTISGGTIFSGSTNLETIISGAGTRIQNGTNTFTGGTAQFPTVNITAATLSTLIVSGNTNLNTLSANTVSGGTIYSGSTDLGTLFIPQSGGLKIKSGTLSGSTFAGNPKTATITFTSPFATASGYTITITSAVGRTWRYESKTASGFTINSGSNTAFVEEVSWQAIQSGEML